MKQTIVIESPMRVSVANGQIVLSSDGGERIVPVEDLGCLMFESQETTITTPAIVLLSDYNVDVVFCNAVHNPVSMMLTLHSQYVQAERFASQLGLSRRDEDGIWQEIIAAKIRNQAAALDLLSKNSEKLQVLIDKVEPGDTGKCEATAARQYWAELFGENFRRERKGSGPNPLLNYGYTVLRSAVARSLMCCGLFPCKGVFHKNRYNDYPLADDIMEPYRPFVDCCVYELMDEGVDVTDRRCRQRLCDVLNKTVVICGEKMRFVNAIDVTCRSLLNRIMKGEGSLKYPGI